MQAPTRAPDGDAALTRLRLQVAGGSRAVPDPGLPADVRSAVALADRVGAPMVPVLDAAQDAERHRRRVTRQVATAVAPARSVGVGLVAMPVLVVPLLGRALGVDLLDFYTSGVGLATGLVALALWAAGAGLVMVMVRRAGQEPRPASPTLRVVGAAVVAAVVASPWLALPAALLARATHRSPPPPPHPDLAVACDLVATGLAAGLTAAGALREAAAELPTLATELRRLAWQVDLGRWTATPPEPLRRLVTTLADGLATGGPLVPALRELAREVRAERGALAEARALRLPARLTFPMSLCLLPATVLAIGTPIVVTGLSAVGGT